MSDYPWDEPLEFEEGLCEECLLKRSAAYRQWFWIGRPSWQASVNYITVEDDE